MRQEMVDKREALLKCILSKLLLLVVILHIAAPVHAQRSKDKQPQKIAAVTKDAEFPGGKEALDKFISENLRYPDQAQEAGIQGRVFLSFMITEEGKVEDIRILRDLPAGCSAEAIRVLKRMPLWNPALYKGKPTKTLKVLPVIFKINR